MPVFVQPVVDGNGESKIVSVFLVTSKDGDAIIRNASIIKATQSKLAENKNSSIR